MILVLIEEGGTNRGHESAERAEHIVDRGRLVPATDHAIGAFWIARLGAVLFPHRGLHQLGEGGGVAVLQQITGLLPAKDVISRVAPGRALVVALAHQELQK